MRKLVVAIAACAGLLALAALAYAGSDDASIDVNASLASNGTGTKARPENETLRLSFN
jgi:hypothetical protein